MYLKLNQLEDANNPPLSKASSYLFEKSQIPARRNHFLIKKVYQRRGPGGKGYSYSGLAKIPGSGAGQGIDQEKYKKRDDEHRGQVFAAKVGFHRSPI